MEDGVASAFGVWVEVMSGVDVVMVTLEVGRYCGFGGDVECG